MGIPDRQRNRERDSLPPRAVFAFFGHPGAGKSTLCSRFGELSGAPSVDTDVFMTARERRAAESGRYTQAMRLANIRRYCAHVRSLLKTNVCVALADGLPNAAAREFLSRQFPEATVVFVLVHAPRPLWEQRLAARLDGPVSIGVAQADAYVREHWEGIPPSWSHEVVENGPDPAGTDDALRAMYRRHVR